MYQQLEKSKKKIENTFSIEHPNSIGVENLIDILRTNISNGLTEVEVNKRIELHGLNSFKEQKQGSIILILLEQFKSPIIILLFVAAGLSFFFKQWIEGYSILVVISITAALGFIMELQARKSMNALKKLDISFSKVLRNNSEIMIPSERIVTGDILLLEAGEIVPADGRLFEINQFQVDESALTGESMPVAKKIQLLEKETILADQINMVFKGTSIVNGNAKLIVTRTGHDTELGKISSLVESAEKNITPLEKKMQGLTKKLIWITAALAAIFIIVGVIEQKNVYLMFETGIAMAIAAIPEGLPVVAIIALTYGALRMARKNVLIKKLSAVETLGGITTIFTDKTGTLTENKIEVSNLIFFDESVEIAKNEYEVKVSKSKSAFEKLLLISTLCNNAVVKTTGKVEKKLGDPIEIALLQFVNSNKINVDEIRLKYPRIAEEAFSSETKLMGTLHKNDSSRIVTAKGAVEEIVAKCNYFYNQNVVTPLTESEKKIFIEKAEVAQSKGLRLLAFAIKEDEKVAKTDYMQNLTLVGFIGFIDPPRMEVIGALQSCRDAGIKVVMITGGHPATALNIAERIKLSNIGNVVISGKELQTNQADEKILSATIFARVNPKQKLDMVNFYQKHGEIVAMTGDGINDAPALKKADIGIAMGLRGTQVAKEAADIVLKDDSFNSIIDVIEQGRIIFQNIKRFLIYLLSCNLSEIFVIFLFSLLNLPFSILPIQILFLNLITDVFPALALGMGKGNLLIMKNPPRNPKAPILVKKDLINILVYAILLTAPIVLISFYCSYYLKYEKSICNSIAFLSLALSQLWHVFNLPSEKLSFLKNEVIQNKFVWGAILLCIIILAFFYAFSPLNKILGLQYLGFNLWLIVLVTSLVPVVLIQILKRGFKIID